METNSTNQWKHSSQIPAQAGKPKMREQQKAEGRERDGAAASRLKAVNYLNQLNQTQWEKITEYLNNKFQKANGRATNRPKQ